MQYPYLGAGTEMFLVIIAPESNLNCVTHIEGKHYQIHWVQIENKILKKVQLYWNINHITLNKTL